MANKGSFLGKERMYIFMLMSVNSLHERVASFANDRVSEFTASVLVGKLGVNVKNKH